MFALALAGMLFASSSYAVDLEEAKIVAAEMIRDSGKPCKFVDVVQSNGTTIFVHCIASGPGTHFFAISARNKRASVIEMSEIMVQVAKKGDVANYLGAVIRSKNEACAQVTGASFMTESSVLAECGDSHMYMVTLNEDGSSSVTKMDAVRNAVAASVRDWGRDRPCAQSEPAPVSS